MAETFEQRLGKRLRKAREAAGMSQCDVIRIAATSQSYLRKLERGEVDPRLSTVVKLAKMYGTTVGEIADKL